MALTYEGEVLTDDLVIANLPQRSVLKQVRVDLKMVANISYREE